jgi:hypothetical protein
VLSGYTCPGANPSTLFSCVINVAKRKKPDRDVSDTPAGLLPRTLACYPLWMGASEPIVLILMKIASGAAALGKLRQRGHLVSFHNLLEHRCKDVLFCGAYRHFLSNMAKTRTIYRWG